MKTFLILVLVVVILGGGYLLYKNYSGTKPNDTMKGTRKSAEVTQEITTNPTDVTKATESAKQGKTVMVNYTDSGFDPKTVTVNKGQTVTWTNKSSSDMWVASNVHPVHSEYDGTTLAQHCANPTNTTFDECKAVGNGQSYSFTFTKAGTWEYHNHKNPTNLGTVVVK